MKLVQVVIAFLFVSFFAPFSPAFAAVEIQKPTFTLSLPDGWVEMPQDVLSAMHEALSKQAPNAKIPKYDYGFQLEAAQNWLEYPYVLVQVSAAGRVPEHQLKSMPKIDLNEKMKDQSAALQSMMTNTSLGKMQYDEAAHVVWITVKSDVVNIGQIEGISGLIPTEKGIVKVHAYATEADFPTCLPIFRQIITSTTISPDLIYKPRWTDSSKFLTAINWGQVAGNAAAGAVIGGVIALFIGIGRKKKLK